MDINEQQKACIAIILALSIPNNKRVSRKLNQGVKQLISKRRQYTRLNVIREVQHSDPKNFINYFRMNIDNYNPLLSVIGTINH